MRASEPASPPSFVPPLMKFAMPPYKKQRYQSRTDLGARLAGTAENAR